MLYLPENPTILIEPATEDQALVPLDPSGVAPKTHRRLSMAERLQVAVWMVEGLSYPQVQALMEQNAIPVVSEAMLSRYRHDDELMDAARRVVGQQVEQISFAYKPVRIKELVAHAQRLKRKIETDDLDEYEEKTFGGGAKGSHSTSMVSKRFAAGLSKEYRETLAQLQKEVDGLVPTANTGTVVNIFQALPMEDQRQFAEAMSMPIPEFKLIPVAPPEDEVEVVDGEIVEAVS